MTENMRLIRCDQKSKFLVQDGPNWSGSTVGLAGAAVAAASGFESDGLVVVVCIVVVGGGGITFAAIAGSVLAKLR